MAGATGAGCTHALHRRAGYAGLLKGRVDQAIKPGDVNWITAGRGITHSERTSSADRARSKRLFGIHGAEAVTVLDGAVEQVSQGGQAV